MNQPTEIIIHIFEYLALRDLIMMGKTNKRFNIIVKTTSWINVIVNFKKCEDIQHVVNNYCFRNFDLYSIRNKIYDRHVKLLTHSYHLNLRGCIHITNRSVRMLDKCVELDLSSCNNITCEGVKVLTGCKVLLLKHCPNVRKLTVQKLALTVKKIEWDDYRDVSNEWKISLMN